MTLKKLSKDEFIRLSLEASARGSSLPKFAAELSLDVRSVQRRRATLKRKGVELPMLCGDMAPKSDDEIIAALKQAADVSAAATALGVPEESLQKRIKTLAQKGFSPAHDMTHPVPDGFAVKGVSTLYREDGTVAAQWVKSMADADRQRQMIQVAVDASISELPQLAPREAHGNWQTDLLSVFVAGDPHFGMLAWADETGDSWDLEIAERVHCGAIDALVEAAPATERALIVNLGDALHYDSMVPMTARSGNMLDADGRYAKMVRVAIKVIRQCIESVLKKHKTVHIINAIGNHDETGAVWLSAALHHIYENEPRVTVDISPAVFNYYRWGKCLIGIHHGHTCKPDKLPGVMASDRASDWGEAKHRYWYMGHIHHASLKEYPGVTVESFGTLASKDAYATAGGWRSRESMTAIVLHKEHGEVGRSLVNPAMLRGAV